MIKCVELLQVFFHKFLQIHSKILPTEAPIRYFHELVDQVCGMVRPTEAWIS
uniref:Uncharacterized protein n=1 Tax=Meloidogyne incognita TaxID=6306 RepID=A0A914MYD2_MELIC